MQRTHCVNDIVHYVMYKMFMYVIERGGIYLKYKNEEALYSINDEFGISSFAFQREWVNSISTESSNYQNYQFQ